MIFTYRLIKGIPLGLLMSLLLTTSAFSAPSVGITSAPGWVISVPPGGKTASAKEISEGHYVVFIDRQVHLGLKTTYTRVIRQIESESGVQNGSEISVYFDPSFEKLNFHHLTIWRNGEAVSQLKSSDFKVLPVETDRQRFIYNGNYLASVILNDVRKGDRIDYAYSQTGWNPVLQDKYSGTLDFGVYDYIPHIHYAIIAETSRKIRFKDFNDPPKKATRKTGNDTVYEWDLKNVKGTPYVNFAPSWWRSDPFVQVSEYQSWQEVVDWGLSFYQVPPVSGVLKTKTEEWKKQANGSHFAYIEQAVRFVQDEIRYLGIETGENSHRPHPPEQVFS